MAKKSEQKPAGSEDVAILSVALASGDFSSQLRIPLGTSAEETKAKMDQWFSMIRFALAHHITDMAATFPAPSAGEGEGL